MKFSFAPAILVVCVPLGQVAAQSRAREHRFDQYPVAVFRGAPARPNFKSLRGSAEFRTRIREGFRKGANFAGHYGIVPIGCGSDCVMGFLIDVKSGTIFHLPLGGETNYGLEMDYRADSRLLKASWHAGMDREPYVKTCVRQEFLLAGSRFKLLRQTKTPGEPCER